MKAAAPPSTVSPGCGKCGTGTEMSMLIEPQTISMCSLQGDLLRPPGAGGVARPGPHAASGAAAACKDASLPRTIVPTVRAAAHAARCRAVTGNAPRSRVRGRWRCGRPAVVSTDLGGEGERTGDTNAAG